MHTFAVLHVRVMKRDVVHVNRHLHSAPACSKTEMSRCGSGWIPIAKIACELWKPVLSRSRHKWICRNSIALRNMDNYYQARARVWLQIHEPRPGKPELCCFCKPKDTHGCALHCPCLEKCIRGALSAHGYRVVIGSERIAERDSTLLLGPLCGHGAGWKTLAACPASNMSEGEQSCNVDCLAKRSHDARKRDTWRCVRQLGMEQHLGCEA